MLLCYFTTQKFTLIKPFNSEKSIIAQATQFTHHSNSTKQSIAFLSKYIEENRFLHYSEKLHKPQSHHSLFIESQAIKGNRHKKNAREKWTQIFATNIFVYDFMYKGFNYKGRRRERKLGRSFPFLIILKGKVHFYWFKPITSRRGRELRDLDLWSSYLPLC